MYYYCLGIRLDTNYMESVCPYRDKCEYYGNTSLGELLSHPETYSELDTYNSDECKYFRSEWLQKTRICETLDSQTDGLLTLLSGD